MSKVTSYSISGVNPTSGDVETLVEVGYDNGNASMWGDAVDNISPVDKLDKLNPVTDGNLVVGFTSAGGGSQYDNAGGTTNVLIAELENINPADYIQRHSYENVLVGLSGNQIGIPDTTTSDSSMYNNAIIGRNNHLASHNNSSTYGNLVVGYYNDVYGSNGDSATLVVGTYNGFNANAGCCIGASNHINATPFDGESWSASGYSKNIIGSFNNVNSGANNTTSILGNSNIVDKESVVIGINNTINSYTGSIGGIISVLGETNTTKYCNTGTIVGVHNSLGDNTSPQGESLTVHSLVGRDNTVTSLSSKSSDKVNTLGVDSYIIDGSFNTIAGSETVVGHDNSATQMSTVIGNYNTVASGNSMTDPTDSTKSRFKGLCIGDWNTSNWGGSDFVIGRNNVATGGSYQIIGDNVNSSGGSSAIGYDIIVNNGSFALGRDITHNPQGGGCVYVGKGIEACSSSVILGYNIKAGYMNGSTPVIGRNGTYVGSNLTVTGSGNNVIVFGTYNEDNLGPNDIFVLADGNNGTSKHNLMIGDSNHNVTFSNNVYAENIPDSPNVEGTYTLQVVVDGSGNKTYSWV